MSDEKLSPQPDPEIEPSEPNPGGADAIDEVTSYAGDDREPLGRDLTPELNPEVEDHVPDEVSELEDKKQEVEVNAAAAPEREPPV